MPTLARLLLIVGLVAAVGYVGMLAAVKLLHPQQHEISQPIELPKQPK